MNFCEKLNFLMDTFNVSGRDLAKAVHVDPSLVSKWQNGKRIPSIRSKYVDNIVDYFLAIDAMEFQKKRLHEALQSDLPDADTSTYASRRKVLSEWLLMPENSSKTAIPNSAVAPPVTLHDLISSIRNMPTIIAQNAGAPVKLPDTTLVTKPGEISHYEHFRGREGIRQAVSNIMSIILCSEEPVEFLITSQLDMTWLVEDPSFFDQWSKAFMKILLQGHNVTIIHNFDRRRPHIVSTLNQWMMLHLTGKLRSYYYPRYEDNRIKIAMHLVKGIAAVFCMSPEDENSEYQTIIYRDPAIVKMLESNYYALLADCNPLFEMFFGSKLLAFGSFITEFDAKPGCYYSLNEGPGANTIPSGLYERLLRKLEVPEEEIHKHLLVHRSHMEAFKKNICYYNYREIYPMEALDNLLSIDGAVYPNIYFLTDKIVKLEPAEVIEHISHTVSLLESYENYEIALIGKLESISSNKVHIVLKEDTSAIISSWDSQGKNPIIMTTSEGTAMHALEDYFVQQWELIPRSNRSKEWVIKKLQDKIKYLEKIIRIGK